MTEYPFAVANTIVEQLGGYGKLKAMLNASHFTRSDDAVYFRWPHPYRHMPNAIKITLTPADLYTIEFQRFQGTDCKTLAKFDGIFCDQLVEIFERETGLRIRL